MKISLFFLLTLCAAGSADAMPSLDSSDNSSSWLMNRLTQLEQEVSRLNSKVAEQSQVIADLKMRPNYLEQYPKQKTESSDIKDTNIYTQAFIPGSNELPDEKTRYLQAYSLFKNGDYNQAIAEFQAIVNTYPNGDYADNAQYWVGEALLKKGDKRGAMIAFDKVLRNYSRKPKVPDALLKLGMTEYSLGNREKAREYYDYLIENYQGTPSAIAAYNKKLQAGLF